MKSFFRTLLICAALACFFVVGNQASAAVFITTSTVWRLSDSPIVTTDFLVILQGVKLTIEPGVVVKFGAIDKFKRVIDNNGILEAIGRPDKPIIFTSINDDSAGGDTNNNGTSTAPRPGDWWHLYFNNRSVGTLNNVIIRYGGYESGGAVVAYKGDVLIKNSVITQNIVGIRNLSGNMVVANSSIFNNMTNSSGLTYDYGISNFAYWMEPMTKVMAINNWWGIAAGPCPWSSLFPKGRPYNNSDLYRVCGTRPRVDVNVFFEPWLTQPPEPEADKRHPVIIIPGILGSWPDMQSNKLVLDPIIHTYDDLWHALIQAGYTTGTNLFAFPYEWRRSNVITAQLLKQKIAEVKAACVPSDIFDCAKVDLIGHSMGGLVARQYIANDDYTGDVDQLIFIATPHKGAPKAYAMWEGGYFGETWEDYFLSLILEYESKKMTGISGDLGLVTYQHNNIDSVKELLPVYPYIYDENLGQVRYYPDNYPTNPFLENLNSAESLNKLKSAVKITNIIGNSIDTITGYSVINSTKPLPMWADGMPRNFYDSKSGVLIGNGDGTVPTISNSDLLDLTPIINNQDHGSVVSYAQSTVIKELTGNAPITEIHNQYNWTSYLMITLQCPADIQIIAPDGKRLGGDINSSTTLAEIPGGYYYYSDDSLLPEYAIIPNPIEGEYKVKVVGTDNGGSYTINTDYITDATSTESQYSGVILPGQEQILNFHFSSSSPLSSEIKSDITIDTAMEDVGILYDNRLILAENSKNKIIQQYGLLKLRVGILDKLAVIADHEIDKWRIKRHEEIISILSGINERLVDLLAGGVLKQLGYDIIKSNNDYLINNW